MRSKGDFSVKEICEKHFGGGGHHNAAGGEIHASFEEAFAKILDIMPECDLMLESMNEDRQ